jgi:hypothetical protein
VPQDVIDDAVPMTALQSHVSAGLPTKLVCT